MRITLRALRFLIKENYYDLDVNQVIDDWPRQFSDAIEFTMCQHGIEQDEAEGYVLRNWVFDTQEHEGKTVLLARDEEAGQAMAWMPNMGGWYFRLGNNKKRCRQSGKIEPKSSSGGVSNQASSKPKTGTAVSGDSRGDDMTKTRAW